MKLFKTLILFFVSQTTLAQFHETIRTSRPGQAIEPFTVGKDILQFQQGLDYYSLADTKYPPHSFISNIVYKLSRSFLQPYSNTKPIDRVLLNVK